VLGATAGSQPTSSPSPAPSPSSASGAIDDHEHDQETPPPEPRVERAARAFLAAYLRYSRGDVSDEVRSALQETATPSLARWLLEQPPHGETPPPGSIARLDGVAGPSEPGRRTVVAVIDRVGKTSALELQLRRRGSSWVVTRLG
jgi:hypothetical protein